MNPRIKESLFFFLVATLILCFSSVPTWAGRSFQTNSLSFAGTFYDTPDYAVHIAMIRSGMEGEWNYQLRFTSEEHSPAPIKMFYVVLGHIGKALSLPPENTYPLFRWLMGYLALFSIFLLCKQAFKQRFLYWCAFVLAVFGSGLGWLQMITGWSPGQITPIDFWLADAYGFFSIATFPHFSFLITLMTAIPLLHIRFLRTHQWRWVAVISLLSVLGEFVNPSVFAVVDAVLLVITLCNWWEQQCIKPQHILALGIIALVQAPLLIYNFKILFYDPVWSQFTMQNLTLSPPPVYYLLGFALLFPFMIIGAIDALRNRNPVLTGMFGWVVSAFVLAYLPLNIQRRFLLAVSIPIGILAIHGFDITLRFFAQKWVFLKTHAVPLFILFLFFGSMSSIDLSLGNVLYLKTLPDGYFYPAALDPVFSWMQDNIEQDEFVLSSSYTGQLVAQKSDLKVYLGHAMETLHFEEKSSFVAAAYQANLPESVLSTLPVDWVIYGPYEQKFAPNFNPGKNLSLVYKFQNVSLYRVVK